MDFTYDTIIACSVIGDPTGLNPLLDGAFAPEAVRKGTWTGSAMEDFGDESRR
jgi:hypothetical protein